jgi:hypothetical protein
MASCEQSSDGLLHQSMHSAEYATLAASTAARTVPCHAQRAGLHSFGTLCVHPACGCSTAQHSTAQHSTAQHSTAQHSSSGPPEAPASCPPACHHQSLRPGPCRPSCWRQGQTQPAHGGSRGQRISCTALHSPAQPCTALHSPAQPCTALHSPAQPCTARLDIIIRMDLHLQAQQATCSWVLYGVTHAGACLVHYHV